MSTATAKHRAMIGGMMVRSLADYIVYGSVRGLVSENRTVRAAWAALKRDRSGCAKQGGYSDACVYHWDVSEGWTLVETDEDESET